MGRGLTSTRWFRCIGVNHTCMNWDQIPQIYHRNETAASLDPSSLLSKPCQVLFRRGSSRRRLAYGRFSHERLIPGRYLLSDCLLGGCLVTGVGGCPIRAYTKESILREILPRQHDQDHNVSNASLSTAFKSVVTWVDD